MATTEYGVNAPEAVKLWSKRLAREVEKKTYIGKFIGQSDDSVIQEKTETKKGAGDRVRTTLRMLLTGDGIIGDATAEGNEESLTTYTDDLLIDQLRHPVRSAGKMSEQRIPFSIREEAMSALRDWWADRMDTAFFNQICGNTAETRLAYTGLNATIAPDASSHFFSEVGATADQDLDSTGDTMKLSLIDDLVVEAKTRSPMIRPIKYQGDDIYVMFLHPKQVRDLRQDASTAGNWFDIQRAAMEGGKVKDNPIFTGAVGMYNGVVLHEATRVTTGVNSSTGAAISTVRRAVLCGAQAATIAFGQGHSFNKYDWVEETFDYKNQLGVLAGCIGGIKKNRFNSVDFGTLVLSTYAA